MTTKGVCPVRSKTVIDSVLLEQVSQFSYLGNDLTCEDEKEVVIKVNRYQDVCGTFSET